MKKNWWYLLEYLIVVHRSWVQNLKKKGKETHVSLLNFKKPFLSLNNSLFFMKFWENFQDLYFFFEKTKITLIFKKRKANFINFPLFLFKKISFEISFYQEQKTKELFQKSIYKREKIGMDFDLETFFRSLPNFSFTTTAPEKSFFNDIFIDKNFFKPSKSQKILGVFIKSFYFLSQIFQKKILKNFPNFIFHESKKQFLSFIPKKLKKEKFSKIFPYIFNMKMSNDWNRFLIKPKETSVFFKKESLCFLVSSNLGLGRFFLSVYTTVFIDPSKIQLTFHQIVKKFSAFYIPKRLRPGSLFLGNEFFNICKRLFPEKIPKSFLGIKDFFFNSYFPKTKKLLYGTIYELRYSLYNFSNSGFGFFNILLSEILFFSPRGLVVSLNPINDINIKKVVFFSKENLNRKKKKKITKNLFTKIIKKSKIFFPKNPYTNIKKTFKISNKKVPEKLKLETKFFPKKFQKVLEKGDQLLKISKNSIVIQKKNFFFFSGLDKIKKIQLIQIKSTIFLFLEIIPTNKTQKSSDINFYFLHKILMKISKKKELCKTFEQLIKLQKISKNLKKIFNFETTAITKKNSCLNLPFLKNLNIKSSIGGGKNSKFSLYLNDHFFQISDLKNKKLQKIDYKFLKKIFYQEDRTSGLFLIFFQFLTFPDFLKDKKTNKILFFFEKRKNLVNLSKKKKPFWEDSVSEEDYYENLKNEKISNNFRSFIFLFKKISGKNIEKADKFFGFSGIKNNNNLFFSITVKSFVSFEVWPPLILDFSSFELIYLERNLSGIKNFDLVIIFDGFPRYLFREKYSWIRILSVENKKLKVFKKISDLYKIKLLTGSVNLNWNFTLKILCQDREKNPIQINWEFLTREEDLIFLNNKNDINFFPDDVPVSSETYEKKKKKGKKKKKNINWKNLTKFIFEGV